MKPHKPTSRKKKVLGRGENPFESKTNRPKFAVLNRKVKGNVVRRTSSTADDRRAQTIGVEFQQRGKTGRFVDKRFGEREAGMTDADKSEMRFHQNRLRQTRGGFNLNMEEDSLTHLGMTLGDSGQANTLQDDLIFRVGEDDEFGGGGGLVDEEAVKAMHFGGGESEDGRKKSKREIMDEIVAKSKKYKAERRQENEEQLLMIQEVDETFKGITPFLSLKPKRVRSEEPAGRRPRELDYEPDEYDVLVNELRAESRDAKAGDRMQSREEEARLRLEGLQALELLRERRMAGIHVGQLEDQEGGDDDVKEMPAMDLEAMTKRVKAGKTGSDDDEDDDEDDSEGAAGTEGGKAGESNKHKKRRERREARAKAVVAAAAAAAAGGGGSGGKTRGSWVVERRWRRDLLQDAVGEREVAAAANARVVDARTGEEMPVVLGVPEEFSELVGMLDGNSLEVGRAALERMLQCCDPLLDPNNAARLARLQTQLLGWALRLTGDRAAEGVRMVFDVLRRLVLMVPSARTDGLAAESSLFYAYRVLLNAAAGVEPCLPSGADVSRWTPLLPLAPGSRRKHHPGMQGWERGIDYGQGSSMPPLAVVLTLLHLSRLFSASDAVHSVWSPAQALLLGWLATARVESWTQLYTGCLAASALLSVLEDARRFAGEPAAFLCAAAARLASPDSSVLSHPHWPGIADKQDDETESTARSQSQRGCVAGLEAWGMALAERPGTLSLAENVEKALAELGASTVAKAVHGAVQRTASVRQALALRPARVAAVRDAEPKLLLTAGLGYRVGDADPDTERRENRKLQRQIKQERRGAIRELKRDREYLNELKAQEFAEETAERAVAWRGINAFLMAGQAEHNKEQKSKLKL